MLMVSIGHVSAVLNNMLRSAMAEYKYYGVLEGMSLKVQCYSLDG